MLQCLTVLSTYVTLGKATAYTHESNTSCADYIKHFASIKPICKLLKGNYNITVHSNTGVAEQWPNFFEIKTNSAKMENNCQWNVTNTPPPTKTPFKK